MNTDPASTDVSSLVDDMRNHRFDGYSANRVANEIDWFRSGVGTGSINDAVDALERVVAALTDTEHTLRTELDKLGVSWNSAGSEGAFQEFGEQAGFSGDMASTLRDVSRVLYEQGDAFNRTRDQLPDVEEVRKAMGGRSVGDNAARMLGFETDHASEVAEGSEAREHAVQLLNEYVTTSGNGLGSMVDTLVPDVPEFGVTTPSPGGGGDDGGADGGDDGSSAVDTLMPTGSEGSVAAGAGPGGAAAATGTPASAGAQSVPSGDGPGSVASSGTTTSGVMPAGGAVDQPVTGAAVGVPGAGGSGHDSGAPAPGGAAGDHRSVPGVVGSSGSGASGYPAGGGPQYGHVPSGHTHSGAGGQLRGAAGDVSESGTSGRGLGRVVSGAGEQASASAPGNKPYAPMSPVDSGNTTQQTPLAKGNMSGVGPQSSAGPGATDGGPAPGAKPGVRSADVGAGAAALGAGGAAGAMSTGEQHGRGVGRSAPNAGDVERAVPFGAAPDEQPTEAARYRDGGLLQRATGGDDVDEHTRSFGVDHTDLFSDDRLVSPERIDVGEADYSDGGH